MNLTTFEFIDRGKQDSIVLVPGWATDYRVFDSLDIDFNYLLPVSFSPDTFTKALVATLEANNLDKISLFGWSLGGFLAYEFAIKHTHFVDKLFLVSIRSEYEKDKIKEIEKLLRNGKKGYLHQFYVECFYNSDQIPGDKKGLFKEYCREMELDYLLQTLDYLSNMKLNPELLRQIDKITIIHGEHDKIAPLGEAVEIKNAIDNARFILVKNTGHMPFLEENFSRYLA